MKILRITYRLKWIGMVPLLAIPGLLLCQTNPTNYIRQQVPHVGIRDTGQLNQQPPEKMGVVLSHYDGLGRPMQEIGQQASPGKKDLVRFFDYDLNGREPREYLDYTASPAKGPIHSQPLLEQQEFYADPPEDVAPTSQPYAEKIFDFSPVNEVIRQGYPGKTWDVHGEHPVQFSSGSNPAPVERWGLAENGQATLLGSYPEYSLMVSETIDENGNITRQYVDKRNRLIMKESSLEEKPVRTAYIYDDHDLLRAVIQPEGTTQGKAHPDFTFFYTYDEQKRMVEKKIPGMEPVYIIFDERDLPILTQDGNLRKKNAWQYSKYDPYGRVVITGIYTDTVHTSRESLQEAVSGYEGKTYEEWISTEKNYSSQAFPGNHITPLTIHYYDQYDFIEDTLYRYVSSPTFEGEASHRVKQLLTGTKIRMLDEFKEVWLTTVYYYDDRGRLIQTISDNQYGGWDRICQAFDFEGKMLVKKHIHSRDGREQIILNEHYTYDHAGRLIDTWQKVNEEREVLVSRNRYNELGQLVEKKLYSADGLTFLQSVNYSYNERGWLRSINDPNQPTEGNDLFAMELNYDIPIEGLDSQAQYNGNISSLRWATSSGQETKGYGFSYDALGRLVAANYGKYHGLWDRSEEDYSEPLIRYDLNGNIDSLVRKGLIGSSGYGLVDVLGYHYRGNQLIALDDEGEETNDQYDFSDRGSKYTPVDTLPEYVYDANGNMVSDANKGIVLITYNYLNLPEEIWLENDRCIRFTYDATGNKLARVATGGNYFVPEKTDYCNNYIYLDDSLAYILTDEGRLVKEGSGFVHEYFLRDHLGNTRVCFRDSAGMAEVTQETHYYPFGLELHGIGKTSVELSNTYLYNGKELHPEHGLEWYDYGARFYDPQVGRFVGVDPIAENFPFLSVYNYASNNPVAMIDLWGLQGEWFFECGPILQDYSLKYTGKRIPTMQDAVQYSDLPEKRAQLDAYAAAGMMGLTTIGTELILETKVVKEFISQANKIIKNIVSSGDEITKINNPVPTRGARVRHVAYQDIETLGRGNSDEVFITAADDIKDITSSKELANRLTLIDENGKLLEGPFEVIEFDIPYEGIASPIDRTNPGFVGKGRTAGGAREFTIPNKKINELKNVLKRIIE